MSAVIRYLAIVLLGLSLLMLVPAFLAAVDSDWRSASTFTTPAILTFGLAAAIIVALRGLTPPLGRAGSLFLVICVWPSIAAIAALPLYAGTGLSYGLAFFEGLSAVTTTGMSVVVDLSLMPQAHVFWRGLLQWYGGALVLVMMVLLLAPMAVGGLPHRRISLVSRTSSRFGDRISNQVRTILSAYGLLTLACAVWLIATGVNPAEALFLALTTVSTGGLTPRSAPLEDYVPALAQLGLIVFMIFGATSILWQGMLLRRDAHQLRLHRESYAVIAAALAVGLVLAWRYFVVIGRETENIALALREGLFAGASLVTTTGFHVREESFAVLPLAVLLLVGLVGGGAMSTAGGLKMFRVGVLLRQADRELSKSLFPHGVMATRTGGHIWSEEEVRAIHAMVMAAILVLAVTSAGLAVAGMTFEPAMTAALAAFSNIGPLYGAGPVAAEPWPHLASIDGPGLWMLGIAMIAGRIEVLAMFGVLNIAYWRNR